MTRAEQIEAAARELLLVTDGHDETHEAEMRVIRAADKLRAALVALPTRAAEEGDQDAIQAAHDEWIGDQSGKTLADFILAAGYRRAPAVTQQKAREVAFKIASAWVEPPDHLDMLVDEIAAALTAASRGHEK